MAEITVTKTRFQSGVWEGAVSGAEIKPDLRVSFQGAPVAGVEILPAPDGGDYILRVPVPEEAVSDGVHTIVITDGQSGETLNSFAILAGEAMNDILRAEVELLREELDLLKRAFRRHCVESA